MGFVGSVSWSCQVALEEMRVLTRMLTLRMYQFLYFFSLECSFISVLTLFLSFMNQNPIWIQILLLHHYEITAYRVLRVAFLVAIAVALVVQVGVAFVAKTGRGWPIQIRLIDFHSAFVGLLSLLLAYVWNRLDYVGLGFQSFYLLLLTQVGLMEVCFGYGLRIHRHLLSRRLKRIPFFRDWITVVSLNHLYNALP